MTDASPYRSWAATPLAGDASSRRYARLAGPEGRTAIAVENDATLARGLCIITWLRALGLAAPEPLWSDPAARRAVLEDLGPLTVAEAIARGEVRADTAYAAARDVLDRIATAQPPAGLDPITPARAADMVGLTAEMVPGIDPAAFAELQAALRGTYATLGPADTVALRDFHAENLIWRGDRRGIDRIGLIDTQDAVLAPAGYDLASLVDDPRHAIDPALRARLVGGEADRIAVLSYQRNLRILGIFLRLASKLGKPRYLAFLPRTRSLVDDALRSPALASLRPLHQAAFAKARWP